jgi:hypothetical protein
MRNNLLCKGFATGIYCFAAFSCNEINNDTKFEFYYYPSKNVYYDVSNAEYLYSLNGGENWDTLHKKMESEPATLGVKQIIYSNTKEILDSNESHRRLYGGNLVNILTADSSLSENDVVTERKFPRKPKPVATVSKKTEKRPGFFKRLFGKKQ